MSCADLCARDRRRSPRGETAVRLLLVIAVASVAGCVHPREALDPVPPPPLGAALQHDMDVEIAAARVRKPQTGLDGQVAQRAMKYYRNGTTQPPEAAASASGSGGSSYGMSGTTGGGTQ